MVAGQIGRDGIEPRFERAIATRRRLAKHTQEGFLGQILSKRPIRPHQPIEVTGEHRLISLDKESQGSHFSCYHLLKELLIAQPLHVCPFFLASLWCVCVHPLNERAGQKVGGARRIFLDGSSSTVACSSASWAIASRSLRVRQDTTSGERQKPDHPLCRKAEETGSSTTVGLAVLDSEVETVVNVKGTPMRAFTLEETRAKSATEQAYLKLLCSRMLSI